MKDQDIRGKKARVKSGKRNKMQRAHCRLVAVFTVLLGVLLLLNKSACFAGLYDVTEFVIRLNDCINKCIIEYRCIYNLTLPFPSHFRINFYQRLPTEV